LQNGLFSRESGYTLIDVAIGLTVAGLLLSGLAAGAKVYLKNKEIEETRDHARIVASAIDNYVLEKGRFPCPARVSAKMEDADYGKETGCSVYDPATKTVALPFAPGTFNPALGLWGEEADDQYLGHDRYVVRGAVPFVDLNIPEFYAYDGFGNRLMYAVSASQTNDLGFINSGGGAITVVDSSQDAGSTGSARRSTHFVVFSAGPSGEGAWTRYGAEFLPCGAGLDAENCNTSASGAGKKARYMSARYSLANGAERFDDIVVLRSSKHMPLWRPSNDNGEDIETIDDDSRVVVKSDASAIMPADPLNAANLLKVDVVGTAGAEIAMAANYCEHGDAGKCFDTPELKKGSGSKFDCAAKYMQGIAEGQSVCTDLTYTCPGHTSLSPKYVRGVGPDGLLICEDVNFSPEVAPFDLATCGASNLKVLASAPTTGLCGSGTASAVTGAGPWNWSCTSGSIQSGGGASVDCVAFKDGPATDGSCGSADGTWVSSAPSSNLCASGTASSVTGAGPWSWSCAGSSGGTTANCSANKVNTVNGSCGSANGAALSSAPAGADLCAQGNPSAVSGSGPWSWTCNGTGTPTGSNASCSASTATPVAGTCGTSNGQTMASAPSSGLCATGTPSAVGGTGPWTWTCAGTGGAASANCQANKTWSPGPCVAQTVTTDVLTAKATNVLTDDLDN